jgi:hypothetical protein
MRIVYETRPDYWVGEFPSIVIRCRISQLDEAKKLASFIDEAFRMSGTFKGSREFPDEQEGDN